MWKGWLAGWLCTSTQETRKLLLLLLLGERGNSFIFIDSLYL